MSNFEEIKKIKSETQKQLLTELEQYNEELKKVSNENDQRLINFYVRRINSQFKLINKNDYELKYMRDNNKKDIENRSKLLREYSKLIKNTIPDNIPIEFYGTNNIDLIKEIINTGYLISKSQKKDESNFTKIEISFKDNIRNVLEASEPGTYSYMPYGAIFAFKPYAGSNDLNDFNFKEEPNRLYSLITTKENIRRIRNLCSKNGIDVDKVNTHDEFINKCNNFGLFNNKTR